MKGENVPWVRDPRRLPDDVASAARETPAADALFRQHAEREDRYAIITLSGDGRVTSWSVGAERVTGWSAADALGRPYGGLYPADGDADAEAAVRVLAEAAERGTSGDEGWRLRKDGSRFWADGSVTALRDDVGTLLGYGVVLRDTTEQRRIDQELRVRARQQAVVAELGQRALVGVDVQTLLAEAADSITSTLAVELGHVLELQPDGGSFRVVAGVGWADGVVGTAIVPASSDTLAGATLRAGAPLVVDDIRRDPRFAGRPLLDAHGATSAASVIVHARGRPYGVLGAMSKQQRRFGRDDLNFLASVAHVLASAIERRRTEEELALAKEAAEAANVAKSQFLANTSHEIRTPLNAIVGYTELLEMGLHGPLSPKQREYLARTRTSSRHLLSLINHVLDLSKIEAGRMQVQREPARVRDAVLGALTLVEPQAAARGVSLSNACTMEAPVWYLGDVERVHQILINLLSNAVRFTERGGRITITCGITETAPPEVHADDPGPWAFVRIEDTGIGIPADRLGAIWEPFVQAEMGHTRAYGGTGLGLTISRHLARLMGGDLTVRSDPGSGSAFFVWLPAAPAVSADGKVDSDRRGRTRHARGLRQIGDVALAEIEHILDAVVDRLAGDPETPSARRLAEAQLEDHIATLLVDIAQCLGIVEGAAGAPSELLRDGSAIQQLVAQRHGAQRFKMGWSEREVRREFEIMREEVARAVRRRVPEEEGLQREEALALFGRFLEHAERASVRAGAENT